MAITKASHAITKTVKLKSGFTVGYFHLSFYMVDFKNDTLTTRLDAYMDEAAAIAGNSSVDLMNDGIELQLSVPTANIDATNGHAVGLLNYIVAGAIPALTGGIVK